MEAKFIKSFVFNHFYQNIIKFDPQLKRWQIRNQ